MDKTINFRMSLDQLLNAIRCLNMPYQQLDELFDVNSASYEALEKGYQANCLDMPEQRLAEERYTVHLELQRVVEAITPVYENPIVMDWLYRGVENEMPPDVLALHEQYSAEYMAVSVLSSKMSILCKVCPNEIFHKYYPDKVQTY